MGLTNFFTSLTSRKEPNHIQAEYSKITPSIFVGTNACCATHFKVLFIDKGILDDISLEGEAIDASFGVETFLWLPTEDHTAPSQKSLHLGVRHIQSVLDRKGKVYIHCKNGHGRAPTLAAAWFISQGRTTDEAVATVHEKRKEAHIEPAQVKALRRFEAAMKKSA